MSKKQQEDVITVECKECGNTFEITKEEQDWYKEKGFELPKRCRNCRKERRKAR